MMRLKSLNLLRNPLEFEILKSAKYSWLRTIIGMLCGLLLIQISFSYLQADSAEQKLRVFRSLIREAAGVANPYLLSQRIEDIEKQGVVKCTRLKRDQESVYFLDLSFKSKCDSLSYGFHFPLGGQKVITRLEGIDGSKWDLDFYSVNSEFFLLSLWLSRIAVIIGFVLVFLYNRRLNRSQELFLKAESDAARAMHQVSQQVAHDIRSPLAALSTIERDLAELCEDKRIMLRAAIGRIKDIANNLLENSRQTHAKSGHSMPKVVNPTNEPLSSELLSSLLDPLITEKRMQFRSKIGVEISGQIGSESYGLFCKIQPTEFKRVISNLVNNAVEVLDQSGQVNVSLSKSGNEIIITVSDNGHGIPPALLKTLGRRGETHGKKGAPAWDCIMPGPLSNLGVAN